MSGKHLWFVVAVLAGCGAVKSDPDAGGDDGGSGSDAAIDAPDPARTVQVAPTGDDANDGHVLPVRSLKRALAIATADTQVTGITLEAGTYDAANGETFPYAIDSNIVIAGPVGGGAVLHGAGIGTALDLSKGIIRNLELDTFATALTTSGTVELANLQVRSSPLGLLAKMGSNLVSNGLAITGDVGSCAKGVVLELDAQLVSTNLVTSKLGVVLDAQSTSTVALTGAMLTGDPTCAVNYQIAVSSTGTFRMTDSFLDGGRGGMGFTGPASSTTMATLTGTTIRNLTSAALGGRNVMFTMTGGALSANYSALETSGGSWSFSNVEMKQNTGHAIYLQGDGPALPGVLKMRGCTVTNNTGFGIDLFDYARGDLGTDADPGNNTLANNSTGEGLIADGNVGATQINAVGNTWRPNQQGASATGTYTAATVAGPVTGPANSNYRLGTNWSLRR